MERIQYDKLVRDNIPHIIASNGDTCSARVITDPAEFDKEIKCKILEEASELIEADSREDFLKEYADLMIALDALTASMEISEADITIAMKESVNKKGLFKRKVFLEWSAYNDKR